MTDIVQHCVDYLELLCYVYNISKQKCFVYTQEIITPAFCISCCELFRLPIGTVIRRSLRLLSLTYFSLLQIGLNSMFVMQSVIKTSALMQRLYLKNTFNESLLNVLLFVLQRNMYTSLAKYQSAHSQKVLHCIQYGNSVSPASKYTESK